MTRRIHTPALLALLTALVLALVGCGGTTTGADAEAARACVQTAMEDVRTQAPDTRQTVHHEWQEQSAKLESGEITKEEYDQWRYNYPNVKK